MHSKGIRTNPTCSVRTLNPGLIIYAPCNIKHLHAFNVPIMYIMLNIDRLVSLRSCLP